MSSSDDLKKDLKRVRDDLKRIADEVRVKLHLAGQDAKDTWANLEPRVREFEQKVEAVTSELTDEVSSIGKDLSARVKELRDKLAD